MFYSLPSFAERKHGKEWGLLCTQVSQKLTTLKKVQEALVSAGDEGINDKVRKHYDWFFFRLVFTLSMSG